MTSWDSPESGIQFSGKTPLFPLPGATLFPNVLLPLHIFEPRYRCMVEDVLKSDRLIAIAMLKDGWESSYETKTCPIHETVCLAQVIADECLEDGKYNLLTQGVCRARLIGEEQTDLPYRIGQLEVVEDEYPLPPVIDRIRRQQELVSAHAMRLDPFHAHRLLEQADVDQRSDLVLELLKLQCREPILPSGKRQFPPGFSLN